MYACTHIHVYIHINIRAINEKIGFDCERELRGVYYRAWREEKEREII